MTDKTSSPDIEQLLTRAETYININAPDGRGSALLVMELADALRARSSAEIGQIPLGLRGHAKWLRNYRNSPSTYHDPLPAVPDALDGIAHDIQELITTNSFNEAQLKRANDEIKRLRALAQGSEQQRIDNAKRITSAVLNTMTNGGDNLAIYEAVWGSLSSTDRAPPPPSCGRAGGNCQCTSTDECPRAFAQANQE